MLDLKFPIFVFCVLSWLTPHLALSQDYCFEEAGKQYSISPLLLWAISRQESGFNPSAINHNRNGSYDYCHMQINSAWAFEVGEKVWASLGDPCQCTMIGAWILARCIRDLGYTWQAVGCYHTKNRTIGVQYAWKINHALNGATSSRKKVNRHKIAEDGE